MSIVAIQYPANAVAIRKLGENEYSDIPLSSFNQDGFSNRVDTEDLQQLCGEGGLEMDIELVDDNSDVISKNDIIIHTNFTGQIPIRQLPPATP